MRLEDMQWVTTEDMQVELVEKKDPVKPLEASKSGIEDVSDLLNKTKGFKYQVTLNLC